jgi:Putative transmembrane protein (PGPGW)
MSFQNILHAIEHYAGWLIVGSVLSFALGVILAPMLIVRLPADYFTHRRRRALAQSRPHPVVHVLLTSGKNLVGALLIVSGFCLFFLPGQGFMTLVAGLAIMNYPGKFRLERWLVRRPHVLPALNWLRHRFGRDPLIDPADDEDPMPPDVTSDLRSRHAHR